MLVGDVRCIDVFECGEEGGEVWAAGRVGGGVGVGFGDVVFHWGSVSGALDVGRVWVPSYDAMMELERIEGLGGENS